jgi:serine O-acetyltransferase
MGIQREAMLQEVVEAVLKSYEAHGQLSHLEGGNLPSREVIWGVVEDLLRLLFPGFLEEGLCPHDEIAPRTTERISSLERRLKREIEKGLRFLPDASLADADRGQRARRIALEFLRQIPAVRDLVATDIAAAYEGDPAAKSGDEIIVAYPGLQAIAVHRMAHLLYLEHVPLVPRVMTEYAHSRTGIDIHPGAKIGKRFFIDHGTGVVIGETCTIGDNVKVYQGVTLGARSFPKDESGRVVKGIKRHPDIEDNVTLYSGATILGNIRIGRGSVIGGNVWLLQSVPPQTRIAVVPPQQIRLDTEAPDYVI